MDAFTSGQYLADLRDAAEAAAKRVSWSDDAVVFAEGSCEPESGHCHEQFRCKIPFNATFGGGTVRYWLTDRGGIESATPLADLEPYQRKIVLRALHGLN